MNQIAQPRKTIIDLLEDPRTKRALGAVAGRYMTADRLTRLVIFAIKKTPKLAACDPSSVLGAVMTTAALELEPNTPRGLAYLIPYDRRGKLENGKWGVVATECQFQIGYKGWIELTNRNPHLIKLSSSAIHQGDEFEHQEGSESFLRFRKSLTERGPLIGSFCYAKYAKENGSAEMAYVMPLEEIEKIRSRSETFAALTRGVDGADNEYKRQKAQEKLDDTPWVMWLDDMAAKSAIKKLCKVLPIGGNLTAAAMLDDAAARGDLDVSAMADPDVARAVADGDEEPPMIENKAEEPMPIIDTTATATASKKAEPAAAKPAAPAPAPAAETAQMTRPQPQSKPERDHDSETGEVFGQQDDGRPPLFDE